MQQLGVAGIPPDPADDRVPPLPLLFSGSQLVLMSVVSTHYHSTAAPRCYHKLLSPAPLDQSHIALVLS